MAHTGHSDVLELPEIREGTTTAVAGPGLAKLQSIALPAAGVGVVLLIIGWFLDANKASFFASYLFAYMFWLGVTTGSLGLLMLHYTVGGGWGYMLRRMLEAATRLLYPIPWIAVLFLPVVVGLVGFHLYEWYPLHEGDQVLREKSAYLNLPFWVARVVFYFAVWMLFARAFQGYGAILTERDDMQVAARATRLGAFGLVVYALTITFMSVDWVMSLTPHWYSSIFGMLTVVSQALSTLLLMLFLIGTLAGNWPLFKEDWAKAIFRDLGNLTLAFVLLWAYMSFSQYLITYSGNTQEEVTYYLTHTQNGWVVVPVGLMLFHFLAPWMVLLLCSNVKKDPVKLAWRLCFWMILMRWIDLWWWVTPTFRDYISGRLADLGAILFIGGAWLWLWARELTGRPLVPLHDPRLEHRWQEVVETDG